MPIPLIDARNVSKTFAGRTVLSNLNFLIESGSVHALLGENGSGKSTFIKILSGFYKPDIGSEVYFSGNRASLPVSPSFLQEAGVAFVHQDLGLVPALSVVENLMARRFEHGPVGGIAWGSTAKRATELLDRVGAAHVRPSTRVGQLPPVEQALVAIARAVDVLDSAPDGKGVLILDEPTAYLPIDSVNTVFAAVEAIRKRGAGVLLVSHRLEDVARLATDVTVLRDGKRVLAGRKEQISEAQIVSAIVGEKPPSGTRLQQSRARSAPADLGDRRLTVEELTGGLVRSCSFSVGVGEVVGLAGLAGMGQSEVLHLLFGSHRASSGKLTVDGKSVSVDSVTPPRAIALGIGFLPADRKRLSADPAQSVADNVTLPSLRRLQRHGAIRSRNVVEYSKSLLERYSVKPPLPNMQFMRLSGGNQQKALVGKWMQLGPRVLMLEEPTAGVDVGGKAEILGRLRTASLQGTAVIIASSDFEELGDICDRVIILRNGSVVTELCGEQVSEERIADAALRTAP